MKLKLPDYLLLFYFVLISGTSMGQPCPAWNSGGCSSGNGNITYIQIRDAANNAVAEFKSVPCSSVNVLLNSGAPIKLRASTTYYFTFMASVSSGGTSELAGWMDFDRNDTFSAGEKFLDPVMGKLSSCRRSFEYKTPCWPKTGSSYLRFRGMDQVGSNLAGCGANSARGNVVDLLVEFVFDTMPKPDFKLPSDNYEKRRVLFSANQKINASKFSWTYASPSTMAPYTISGAMGQATWPAAGNYSVKMVETYCHFKDSVTKIVVIKSNTKAPSYANFYGDSDSVPIYEDIYFHDSSGNATDADWEFISPSGAKYTATGLDSKLTPDEMGYWKICVAPYNAYGAASKSCKSNFLYVMPPKEYYLGPPNPNHSISGFNGSATWYRFGSGKLSIDYVKLLPCKAKNLQMNIGYLKVLPNYEVISIYDGTDESGPRKARITNANYLDFVDSTIQFTSGYFYMTIESASACDGDSMMCFSWTSQKDTNPPLLKLFGSDTIYYMLNKPDDFPEIPGTTFNAWNSSGKQDQKGINWWSDVITYRKGIYSHTFEKTDCDGRKAIAKRVVVVDNFPSSYFAKNKIIVYWDKDSNYLFDSTDLPLSGITVEDRANGVSVTTDESGSAVAYPFSKFVSYQLRLPPNWKYVLPSDGKRNWLLFSTSDTLYFSIRSKEDLSNPDLKLTELLNDAKVKRGFVDYQKFTITNNWIETTDSIELQYTLDRKYVVQFPDSNDWHRDSSGVYRRKYYHVKALKDIAILPGVVIPSKDTGSLNVELKAIILGSQKDKDTTNNSIKKKKRIVNPFDPNDKTVVPEGDFPNPGEWMEYRVRFQNTGTAEAMNVIVRDTLSPNLDTNSFELIATSHPAMILKRNNFLTFQFLNIHLPDSGENERESHGWIRFKVKSKNNLAGNSEIKNRVSIYFDFEDPIMTNTAKSRFSPKPTIRLLGAANMKIGLCDVFDDPGAVATDTLDGDISAKIKVVGLINSQSLTTDVLTYTITNSCGQTAIVQRRVEKTDETPPIIYFNGKVLKPGMEVRIPVFTAYIPPVKALDGCIGDIPWTSSGGVLNTSVIGNYEVKYHATDASGNAAEQDGTSVTYVVFDSIPPVINLNVTDTPCVETNTHYSPNYPVVTDNYSTLSRMVISVIGSVDSSTPGVYAETFVATDESGNTAQKTHYIMVGDCDGSNVGLKNPDRLVMKIFPNPAHEKIEIHSDRILDCVELFSVQGQKMWMPAVEKTAGLYILEVQNLPDGVYFIRTESRGEYQFFRVVVSHP